ncbi:PAAR domain-containing protein [Paenibacillus massiliensis]|uniref:hypothetical protein n=1 Tax=Paenibacillus massiliensis TaxID=225917 RepID=UPI0012EBBD84|nr:hypothetical protein [Paenibacillus massiliensis]
MIIQAAAIVGSEIAEFTLRDFIQWVRTNSDGDEIGDKETDAEITGYVSSGSSKLYIQGSPVARLNDITSESARSLTRPEGSRWRIVSRTSGNGRITGGVSTSLYVEGQPVAFIGSMVTSFADSEEIPLVTGSNHFYSAR